MMHEQEEFITRSEVQDLIDTQIKINNKLILVKFLLILFFSIFCAYGLISIDRLQ